MSFPNHKNQSINHPPLNVFCLCLCLCSLCLSLCVSPSLSLLSQVVVREDGRIGIRTSFVELRLESVPDKGFCVTDKPNPRGEVWIRSLQVAPGQYLPDSFPIYLSI